MKPHHFILPGLAITALTSWYVFQYRSDAELATQSQALQQKITATNQANQAKSLQEISITRTKGSDTHSKTPDRPMDWKDFAARLAEALREETTNEDPMLTQFNQHLAEMTASELLTALDEVAALGLEETARGLLEETLVEALIPQNPAAVLAKFSSRIQDESDGVGWQLAGALGQWAKLDLAAATAWFDQEITAGRFESKSLNGHSEARLEFEAALLDSLLPAAPKAAAARLAALPEDQRRATLEQIATAEISPTGQRHYVGLLRELLPPAERADALGHLVSEMIAQGGYPQITEFLTSVQATPEERAAASRAVAGNQLEQIASERPVTRNDLEILRGWLQQQSPSAVDRMTGEALGYALQEEGELDFTTAAALVLEYHRSSGNDDIITGFLETSSPGGVHPQAKILAEKISDPKRREEALTKLK